MFRYAIDAANNARVTNFNLKLEALSADVPYGNEFIVSKKLCRHLKVIFNQFISICCKYL